MRQDHSDQPELLAKPFGFLTRPMPTQASDEHAVKCELAGAFLRSFGTLRFAATGWSMLPSVWPGETLVVERLSQNQVRVGDVVLFEREGGFCAHRVVRRSGDPESEEWITQGDALPVADRPVSEGELLGRVTHLIRDGKCVPVPSELSVVQSVLAGIVRRSVPAARALVYLNRIRRPKESTTPCPS